MIGGLSPQIGLYLLAAFALGAAVAWLVYSVTARHRMNRQRDQWQIKLDDAIRQRDQFNAENIKLRASIESLQALVHKHEIAGSKIKTELDSTRERTKALSKEVFELRTERDELTNKFNNNKSALSMAQYQVSELEAEFVKAGEFYKGELAKAIDKRKEIETKLEDARAEHQSLSNLLAAAKSENESVNKMLAAAQTRLDNLDAMEANVIRLEAENAELRHSAARTKQEIEALQRDVAELEELKIQNKELAHCLQSMEHSRKQYEADAQRYRVQANQSEKRTETLRMKLDDVEKSFADMARKHDEARKLAKDVEAVPKTNGEAPPARGADDLTEIVGIGKVFQKTLNDLGIYSFRQIAAFGPSDIARVNMQLKEFRGRMEQDDWIGQAKELHFKKYGGA